MTDSPRRSVPGRTRFAVVLLVIGLVVAFVPGLAAGNSFLPRSTWIAIEYGRLPPWYRFRRVVTPSGDRVAVYQITPDAHSKLTDLASSEPDWTAAVAALLTGAPLFLWWRRGGLPFVRIVGVAACVAAAAAVSVLALVPRLYEATPEGGVWWTMPLGALLMAAAFLVAPAPVRSRDD